MNIQTLVDMQSKLDAKIREQHDLKNEDLVERKLLALLVEIGELANETRCFKYWSIKPPSNDEIILEEYVDGLHFILSIGIELKYEPTVLQLELSNDLVSNFMSLYREISHFQKEYSHSAFNEIFNHYLSLGKSLGYSHNQIENAYMSKNDKNHIRQQKGY
ncbi:dUTP diphosphatase [Bacillus timonensis]|nr:dUTP diphosphatase [Bacillus timonensis]